MLVAWLCGNVGLLVRLKYLNDCWMDVFLRYLLYVKQRMNPNDFDVLVIFLVVPPTGQSFHLFSEKA